MVKVTAVEFMRNNPVRKRVSVLEPFQTEIFELKSAGYSIPQILEFLKVNEIEVSKTTLISFIKVRKNSAAAVTSKNVNLAVTTVKSSAQTVDRHRAPAMNEKQSSAGGPNQSEPQLVEKNGRTIDVNYKPSWVDDDINLADLI